LPKIAKINNSQSEKVRVSYFTKKGWSKEKKRDRKKSDKKSQNQQKIKEIH